ncbi:hypothetical protein [Clostridium perfringens]|uniref:hypothetical protein n=1 Tax=Clostridium perfringens TaxID=1502 RepID=UPI00210CA14A|nr:hypothetical protein [Clostridium perfringens]
MKEDNPLRYELFTLGDIEELKNKYNIKSVIITHLEEDFGKSYDDYVELEKELDGIKFAYDGMKIEI